MTLSNVMYSPSYFPLALLFFYFSHENAQKENALKIIKDIEYI